MHPEHYSFLAGDKVAEMRREVAGDQRLARSRRHRRGATTIVLAHVPAWRPGRPQLVKLGRLLARHP